VPAAVTIIDEVVAPVLQLNEPVAVVLNVELPQLFETFITGDGGIDFGEAKAVEVKLMHPLNPIVLTL